VRQITYGRNIGLQYNITTPSYFPKNHLIVSFHLRQNLPTDLFPFDFPTKILYTFKALHACLHLVKTKLANKITLRVKLVQGATFYPVLSRFRNTPLSGGRGFGGGGVESGNFITRSDLSSSYPYIQAFASGSTGSPGS
jgi:hypothetical protein